MAHFGPEVVPLHARALASLATDAAADVDQLRNFLLMIAYRRRRHGRRRAPYVILRLQICHRMLLLQATGALVFSTLTKNALNSGVCVLASPTEGVSVLAP